MGVVREDTITTVRTNTIAHNHCALSANRFLRSWPRIRRNATRPVHVERNFPSAKNSKDPSNDLLSSPERLRSCDRRRLTWQSETGRKINTGSIEQLLVLLTGEKRVSLRQQHSSTNVVLNQTTQKRAIFRCEILAIGVSFARAIT
jgi:hypothetical protein